MRVEQLVLTRLLDVAILPSRRGKFTLSERDVLGLGVGDSRRALFASESWPSLRTLIWVRLVLLLDGLLTAYLGFELINEGLLSGAELDHTPAERVAAGSSRRTHSTMWCQRSTVGDRAQSCASRIGSSTCCRLRRCHLRN